MEQIVSFTVFALMSSLIVALSGIILRIFIKDRYVAWVLAYIATIALASLGRGVIVEGHTLAAFAIGAVVCFFIDSFWARLPQKRLEWLTWRGTIDRGPYVIIGVVLFAIKHNLDRFVASYYFDRRWSVFNYWIFNEQAKLDDVPAMRLRFYATLLLLAIPFIYIGVVLTLKRLRAIGLPLWLVAFFFVPFLNLFFFLLLAVLPSRDVGGRAPSALGEGFHLTLGRVIPNSALGSAAFGVLVTVPLAFGATFLSINALGDYGWGLFVGLPFFLGLISVLIYGFHAPRGVWPSLLVALISVVLVSAALFALAVEGLICLMMAAPLGVILALFGGLIGYVIQRRPTYMAESFQVFSLMLLALPLLLGLEHAAGQEPPLFEVRTAVSINAPPEQVWQNLVAFTELPPPTERLFKTGIAYPIRAEISGRGVGAVRHCIFSTGAFVEPIEVWDEPRLLKFGVTAQPPVMNEVSVYTDLRPPHLENYLHSRKGQFLLTRLPDGGTRLEGTTWYQNDFWPGLYWKQWSDYIIHRIHLRVLEHIKQESEKKQALALKCGYFLRAVDKDETIEFD